MQPLHILTPCQAASAGHWVGEPAAERRPRASPSRGEGRWPANVTRARPSAPYPAPELPSPTHHPVKLLPGLTASQLSQRGRARGRLRPGDTGRVPWVQAHLADCQRAQVFKRGQRAGGGRCTLGCLQARDDSVEQWNKHGTVVGRLHSLQDLKEETLVEKYPSIYLLYSSIYHYTAGQRSDITALFDFSDYLHCRLSVDCQKH